MQKKFFCALFVFMSTGTWLLFLERPVFAYLDPGTGSYVFQLLFGSLFVALILVKQNWARFKEIVRKIIACVISRHR
jgi:hypothetical protein